MMTAVVKLKKQAYVIWKNQRVEYIESIDDRPKLHKNNENIALIVNVKRKNIRMFE